MRLNYNDMLLLAIWEYNRRQDEDLTLELFQETFGQVPGAHFHDKWVHYYNKNLLMMAAYFRGEEEILHSVLLCAAGRAAGGRDRECQIQVLCQQIIDNRRFAGT